MYIQKADQWFRISDEIVQVTKSDESSYDWKIWIKYMTNLNICLEYSTSIKRDTDFDEIGLLLNKIKFETE